MPTMWNSVAKTPKFNSEWLMCKVNLFIQLHSWGYFYFETHCGGSSFESGSWRKSFQFFSFFFFCLNIE